MPQDWLFWIDRGGTFTDIVAKSPSGDLIVHKLLSRSDNYSDAAIEGINQIILTKGEPGDRIGAVRMGTTVATNALLEHAGEPTVLAITAGFADQIRIGYQNRPDIFALNINLPRMLYEHVIEIDERISAGGGILAPLNEEVARARLMHAFAKGFRSVAIVLMHAYRFPRHEQRIAELAKEVGFTQISTSHATVPLPKIVTRGATTLADAYLSPVLRRYIESVRQELQQTPLFFMQSNGGLAEADHFRGKDSILSGPAGGMIGAVRTAAQLREQRIITFDMGGTSTDVAHYAGELERQDEIEIAGARIHASMLSIHTVAAGGGSILRYDAGRFRVGPQSAGALPGPACYGNGGPLTVTDCNVRLGRIQADFFPRVFGHSGTQPLDENVVSEKFEALREHVNSDSSSQLSAEQVAFGFLKIAVEKMANAIKQVSTQKGHDPSDYLLYCFGGAGGQHACMIADSLGIRRILVHKFASVLSAYGIGLADVGVIKEMHVQQPLNDATLDASKGALQLLVAQGRDEVIAQLAKSARGQIDPRVQLYADVRYEGTDFALRVPCGGNGCGAEAVTAVSAIGMKEAFSHAHLKRYGFEAPARQLLVEKLVVAASASAESDTGINAGANCKGQQAASAQVEAVNSGGDAQPALLKSVRAYFAGAVQDVPAYSIQNLPQGSSIAGPALFVEPNSTVVCEPGWEGRALGDGTILLFRGDSPRRADEQITACVLADQPDPVLLELFNNIFMFVAEQMGVTLQNTSYSVNIKERLDFSCALFDENGNLVANAPHIPVHLGSMGESVHELIRQVGPQLRSGDVYALNDPYHGGTHLPDITVITPFFAEDRSATVTAQKPLFYVASRGHHADVGGITPGSMPPHSRKIEEEGVLLNMLKIVDEHKFLESEVLHALGKTSNWPARNLHQNIADLQAQVAANQRGLLELQRVIDRYGFLTVQKYMQFIQDNAARHVRELLSLLPEHGSYACAMDCGAVVKVAVSVHKPTQSAVIDFTGTSAQLDSNFNAPASVCKAAVMYVFRTLIKDDIPLNAGFLRPLQIIIPNESMLSPHYPAAVVAGNVETSQVIVDALYGALGVSAAAQGTMNNFTFGNERYQYYETIAGGSGATATANGASAVQTHMTNSRMTDPEILELRYPVVVERFAIRRGSGGAGRMRGGDGVVRILRFLEPMQASILSNRRQTLPFGLNEGVEGQPGVTYIERGSGGPVEYLGFCGTAAVEPGDRIVIETPGGGGYGAPLDGGSTLVQ